MHPYGIGQLIGKYRGHLVPGLLGVLVSQAARITCFSKSTKLRCLFNYGAAHEHSGQILKFHGLIAWLFKS